MVAVSKFLASKWYVFALIVIFILAFYLRAIPGRFPEIQDLDSTYFFRAGLTLLNNNFALPEKDMMREYPVGFKWDTPAPIYIPALLYVIFNPLLGTSYLNFVLLYSPIMGALAVILVYFVAKELYDRKAGIIASFFAAVFPATISRTTSGFLEKEAISAIAIPGAVYFFIRAYKTGSVKSSIIAGLFVALMGIATGMVQYMYFLFGVFALILLVINKYSDNLVKAYLPLSLVGTTLPLLVPLNMFVGISLSHPAVMISYAVSALLILRWAIEKFSIVRREYFPYIIPGILVIGLVGLLIGSLFFDPFYMFIQQLHNYIFFDIGVTMSTVAENNPGSWGDIIRTVGVESSIDLVPHIHSVSFLFSAWFLMFIGMFLAAYKIYKNREFSPLFYLIWVVSGIWSIFGMIRLMFLLGPPTAVFAGFALSYIIDKAGKYDFKIGKLKKPETVFIGIGGIFIVLLPTVFSNPILLFVLLAGGMMFLSLGIAIKRSYSVPILQKIINALKGERENINLLLIPIIILLLFTVSLNVTSGYIYSNSLGPMMNPYWYEAMDFLANKTPQDSNILSWWDFGYIFQHYGKRPTVTDGGWGPRDPVADWFVSAPENWTSWEWYIKGKYHVDYILMDYTLPGKYGAISKIAYRGNQIFGIPQFTNSGVQPQGNKTIYEFSAGPYVIWIPFDKDMRISGTPMFLISQGGQFVSKAYINDMCTEGGIAKIGDEQASIGGCITFTKYGLFYVPEEVENTIFTSLMFMDGWGLPVKKVFDNGLIKIYEVEYGNETNSTSVS